MICHLLGGGRHENRKWSGRGPAVRAMTGPDAKPELRDGETIRAYLDEVARLQTPVQLWLAGALGPPFETTLQKVSPITFSTTTTPPLEPGQVLDVSFMVDSHRFVAKGKVVTPGVFRIPVSIAQGERRGAFRVPFDREPARVFAVEHLWDTVLGGRTLLGRVLNLSTGGLRVALDELGGLGDPAPLAPLRPGDRFGWICLDGLPFTPRIHCRARVAHLAVGGPEPAAGLHLEELAERDRQHLERILVPRFPATFGETFPARKRKTDFADQLGAPAPTQARTRAPELVNQALAAAEPAPAAAARTPAGAVMRLRRAARRLLFLSANPGTGVLAEAFRQDGFKQVFEAQGYQQAKLIAEQGKVDLLFVDVRIGAHWTRDILRTLGSHGLLVGTPVILLTDQRSDVVLTQAQELEAVHVHERRREPGDLLELVCRWLLDEAPVSNG